MIPTVPAATRTPILAAERRAARGQDVRVAFCGTPRAEFQNGNISACESFK
jgi:hypothetical protein